MEVVDIYRTMRTELCDLAPTLSAEQRSARCPATPPWSVQDAYAHLTGVCADLLDGNNPGQSNAEEWTANQVSSRSGKSLEEICAEWTERGPDMDGRLAAAGADMAFMAFDAFTHGTDIRAAAGVDNPRDSALVTALAGYALGMMPRFYSDAPTLAVTVDGETTVVGDGDHAVTLTTTPYELLRIVFGRRSEDQLAAAAWSGTDVAKARDAIHIFNCPKADLAD